MNRQIVEIDFDEFFSRPNSKINTRVKLTPQDKRDGVRVYCKEQYAQEHYDSFYSNKALGANVTAVKDFHIGEILSVRAKSIDFTERVIEATHIQTGVSVFIPFREYSFDPTAIADDKTLWKFKAMVYKNHQGTYFASERKCAAVVYREDMEEFAKENQWFTVKVSELVKGGYLALYKNSVKCFLPGSHAAANVIHDFQDYLNREIPVMIESYDEANKLFIVSYKKYIKHTLQEKIYDLSFTKQYTGRLTDKPHGIGMFVELENYFTGLVHNSEFADYEKARSQYRAGDTIQVYVKDITFKKGEPRIVLTLDKDSVNEEKLKWQSLSERINGKALNYVHHEGNVIEVDIPNSDNWFELEINPKQSVKKEGRVKITSVDVLRQHIKFELL